MRHILRAFGYFLLGVLAVCSIPLLLAYCIAIHPFYVLGRSMVDQAWGEKYEREHPDLDMGV